VSLPDKDVQKTKIRRVTGETRRDQLSKEKNHTPGGGAVHFVPNNGGCGKSLQAKNREEPGGKVKKWKLKHAEVRKWGAENVRKGKLFVLKSKKKGRSPPSAKMSGGMEKKTQQNQKFRSSKNL